MENNDQEAVAVFSFPSDQVRAIGVDEARFTVPDDFDAPLPREIEDSFYR